MLEAFASVLKFSLQSEVSARSLFPVACRLKPELQHNIVNQRDLGLS